MTADCDLWGRELAEALREEARNIADLGILTEDWCDRRIEEYLVRALDSLARRVDR